MPVDPRQYQLDLHQLEVLVHVIEEKSFSRAAERVFLSQPTVSGHIAALEQQFGHRLVDRLGREVLPTALGEILYKYARQLLRLKQQAVEAVAEVLGQVRGTLRIGGSTIPGTYVLPRLAAEFHALNPEVSVIVKIGDTAEITNAVLESVLDMGFVGSKPSESRIDSDPYGIDELAVVVRNDHPWADKRAVSLEELGTQPILIRELGSGTRETFEDALRANGKTLDQLQIVAELGSSEAIKQGVIAGLGAGIISVIAVEDSVRVGALVAVPVEKLKLKRDFYRIWHRQRDPSPLARLFTRFLADHKTSASNVTATPPSSGSGRRKSVPKGS